MKRRHFIQLSGLAVVGGGAYSLNRGIRFPIVGLELPLLPDELQHGGTNIAYQDAILIELSEKLARFRAVVPEPKLELMATTAGKFTLTVENVSQKAQLDAQGTEVISESTSGIQRTVELDLAKDEHVTLQWSIPDTDSFRFAAIGDSGGGPELGWCIKRAAELGADFMLHLGDLNYRPEDYELARANLLGSPIPVYVTIGNHDYRDQGNYYHDQFRSLIGRLNNEFTLGGIRFINIDTASDIFPASRGHRGRFMAGLQSNPNTRDIVVFTHRPMADPRPNDDHNIGDGGQIPWLVSQFKRLGATTLLAGHIHTKMEIEHEGIHNFIAGQGLAIEDVIAEKSVAEILIGEVIPNEKVHYQWEPLLMPFDDNRNLDELGAQIAPKKFTRLKSVLPN